MRYKATYYCGYCGCGCDEPHYFIADSEDDVIACMDENLYEYAESNTHIAFGWDSDYTDEEFETFVTNDCSYDIIPIKDEDFAEFLENEGISEDDFEDLT